MERIIDFFIQFDMLFMGETDMVCIDFTEHFHHPIQNFVHGDFWGDKSENAFGNTFAEAYKNRINTNDEKNYIVIAIRELPVPGNGIADLVVIKKRHHLSDQCTKSTIQAFEFKLNNWRSGLMQALRYKYFSNTSILVLPIDKISSAVQQLDIFRCFGVGLWGFNPNSGVITPKHTPRPKKVVNIKRAEYVLKKVNELETQI